MVGGDNMYVILQRENIEIHLQWHENTDKDPLLGGSVVRFRVENIDELFKEFVNAESIKNDQLKTETAWGINEFGLYDLNKNALFFFEDVKH